MAIVRLLGRADELAGIDTFLDTVSPGPADIWVLLLAGLVGIGKTALWDEARERARQRGFLVLSARAVEAEAPMGFAVLGDLFASVPDAVVDLLPAPQRQALRIALLREEISADPPDPRSVATATLGVVRELAREQPVLLAVDDVGVADPETAQALAFAVRRLGADRVGLLATTRTADDDAIDAGPILDAVDPAHVVTLRPGVLSLGALGELLRERLAFTGTRRDLVRLHEASGGNPLLALELARAAGAEYTGAAPLAVPASLRRLVGDRVAGLPPAVRDLLLLAALTPNPSAAVLLPAAGPDARTNLDLAEDSGILVDAADGLRFGHPLLRSVVSGDATASRRRDAHSRLAAASSDPDEIARHRALAVETADADIAEALDVAARRAHLQGAFDTAAELGDLALARTPPTDPAVARTVTVARYRFDAGDPAHARDLIAGLLAGTAAAAVGDRRGELLFDLATYQRHSGVPLPVWERSLHDAVAAAGDDVDLLLRCHMDLGFAAANSSRMGETREHADLMAPLIERCTDRALSAQARAGLVWVDFATNRGLRRDHAERALAMTRDDDPGQVELSPRYSLMVPFAFAGELDRARELGDQMHAALVARGDEAGRASIEWLRARVEVHAGRWARAEEHCEVGRAIGHTSGNLVGTALVLGSLALLRAGQGRVDEAQSAAAEATGLGERLGLHLPALLATEATLQLELSRGDAAAAVVAARSLAGAFDVDDPDPSVVLVGPDCAEALVRAGDLDRAEALLDHVERFAAKSDPVWFGIAIGRTRALAEAARGDLEHAEALIAVAVDASTGMGRPLEVARTLLVAGEIHRRARRRRLAHDRLSAARAIAIDLGAALWLSRCDAELARTGTLRASASDDGAAPARLTETEERVATLAAAGRTSREIAAALFTSTRTVETHLQHVYRKLGVRSRLELARRLDSDT